MDPRPQNAPARTPSPEEAPALLRRTDFAFFKTADPAELSTLDNESLSLLRQGTDDERVKEACAEIVYARYKGFLKAVARKRSRPWFDAEDALQLGAVALLRSMDIYDDARGGFGTVLRYCLLEEVASESVRCNGFSGIDSGVLKAYHSERAKGADHEAAVRAVAARRGKGEDRVARIVEANLPHDSMSPEPGSGGTDDNPGELRGIDAADPDAPDEDDLLEGMDMAKFLPVLREAVSNLPPREAEVLGLLLQGFNGQDVALATGVTRERVRQLRESGVKRLVLRLPGVGSWGRIDPAATSSLGLGLWRAMSGNEKDRSARPDADGEEAGAEA